MVSEITDKEIVEKIKKTKPNVADVCKLVMSLEIELKSVISRLINEVHRLEYEIKLLKNKK